MKHGFIDFIQVVFLEARKQEMGSQGFEITWNIALSTLPSRILRHPEGRKWFSGPFDHLIHRFFDLGLVAFLDAQKTEN
jgi:hypothetical protein